MRHREGTLITSILELGQGSCLGDWGSFGPGSGQSSGCGTPRPQTLLSTVLGSLCGPAPPKLKFQGHACGIPEPQSLQEDWVHPSDMLVPPELRGASEHGGQATACAHPATGVSGR